ncbi:2-Ketoisovalerate:ferredoxin oxidoreductase (VOR), alpha subunit [Acidilobus saccharovorans 345-15]|uniref:2-oxoacid oxidoreductase (ferredoxin) n=1 Tax=Acidilobus saccharovorans (strain DSM 16705 / JCM 18335 / VKM B-2471 / 345-15) TaxID=666510 RepID=D9Q2C1_ACIS3|nr:transketolase C-terminal domain-containing protein [Acidilobus saccharovorans]ADL19459.1 2-Ketoisovalerate:ferredoxin oxidoreductase (VOR), alpha subunit [Acidilobus saccharovorans 345-15]
MTMKALTGNHAVSEAVKLARVEVIAAYPITPQTTMVEKLAEMVDKGELEAKMIRVESEHSALAATLGAAAAGARAFTATSSHGLLYMHEVLWWTAGARIPVVMAVAARAIGPPWNIHVEHSDVMDQRDTGWIISVAQENQEAFDLTLQAFRISEDPRVYLPMIVTLDGFILSHTVAPVDIPSQEEVDNWLPPRRQPYVITPESNVVMGNIASDEDYFMMRYSIQAAMKAAKQVISEVDLEYGKAFGRSYGGLVECYRCDDADYVIVITGSWAGDAKKAADMLRDKGVRAGVARIRFVRPWPEEDLRDKLSNKKGVIVFDRSVSFGSYGQLFSDTAATLYGTKVSMRGVIAGLGGVDVRPDDIMSEVMDFVGRVEEVGLVYEPQRWMLPKKYAQVGKEVGL